MSDLLDAWKDTLPPSAPASAVVAAGEDLLARWSEPHRHYHNLDHLTAVLGVIELHVDSVPNPMAVRLAAWFHDAVYNPRRLDNEEASALLAEETLPKLNVSSATVAEVARLVRLTASHDPLPGDRNAELLIDADLAILASDRETYRAYTQAVRREYAHASDAAFAAARAEVLRNLLGLPRLFHIPALRDTWEDAARCNLMWELTVLRGQSIASAQR